MSDLRKCPECGREVERIDMEFTTDCHGIPFRLLCIDCYDKIMDEKGYDGEIYGIDADGRDYEI